MLKLTELQVSSRNHPIGLDEQPVFSWKMVSDIPDTIQTAYRVRVEAGTPAAWRAAIP